MLKQLSFLLFSLTDLPADSLWANSTVLTLFLSNSAGAVTTNFIGLIVAGFGYSQLRSMLLQAPAFAIQAVVCLLVTGLVTFTKFFRNAKQPLLSVAALAVISGTAVIYSHDPTPQNQNLLLGMLCQFPEDVPIVSLLTPRGFSDMIALNNCSFTTISKCLDALYRFANEYLTDACLQWLLSVPTLPELPRRLPLTP